MATYSMRDRDVKPEIVCPYNQHHQVSKNKLTEHVKKCRRNWRLEQYKKDEDIHVFTCQHNPEHLVVAPELMWHEARCHDRGKVRGYQLNVQPFKDAGLWDFDLDLEDYPPDAKEQGEIWKGVKLGVITSASVETWGAAVYAEEIKYPSLKKIREAREKEEAAIKERERLEKERLEEIRRSKMTQEERDEEDYWNKTNPGPGFDYWYSMTDPDVKWRRMPIHLTKAQRKKWGQVEKPKAVVEVEEETDGAQAEEVEPTSPVVARPSSPVPEPLSFVSGPTYSEVAQGMPPAKQPSPPPVTEKARQVEPAVEKPLAPVKETLPKETVPEAAVTVTPVIKDTLPAVSGKETLEASLEMTTPTVAEETAIEAEESLPPSAETSTPSEERLPTPETLPDAPEAAKLVSESGPTVTEPPAVGAALEETTTKSTIAENETPAEEPSPLPPSPSDADALPPAAETLQTAKPAPTAKEPALEETTPTSTVAETETPVVENFAPPPPPPIPSQVTPPIVTESATPVEETPPKQAVTEMETPMEVDAPPPSPEDDFDLDALDNQTLEGMIDCIDIKVMEAEEHPETFNADEMEGFLNIRKRCLIIIRNRTQERLNAVEEKEMGGQSAA